MRNFILLMLTASITSCAQETPKVKQVHKPTSTTQDLKKVKVVNALDPICNMNTAEFLKDTIVYQSKTYGFCSDFCKKEFKKNPKKYVQ